MVLSIYKYIDYRVFLTDAVNASKETKPHFSYRYIAQNLGLRSSGYFLYILQGKRKISEALALKTANFFKLNKKETEYFLLIVNYAHAKSHIEKQFLFERIAVARRKTARSIDQHLYSYYEKWYYLAIREYMAIHRFTDDFACLARSLNPNITLGEAKEAVATLEKLGLIRKSGDGSYARTDVITTTGDTWQSETIHNLQQQFLDISKASLENLPKEQRDFSNLTVSMSPETWLEVKKKFADLRALVLEMAQQDKNADSIYQINIQAFPLHTGKKEDAQ